MENPQKIQVQRTDFELLIRRIREGALKGEDLEPFKDCFTREDILECLEPAEALEWARIAQVAGYPDSAIQILKRTTEKYPEEESLWLELIELLSYLDRQEDLLKMRAKALIFRPDIEPKILIGEGSTTHIEVPQFKELDEPFLRAKKEEALINRYMELFSGREDCFARQWADEEGNTGYVPVRRPIDASDVREHLLGRKTYGIYLLKEDSRTTLGVLDLDLKAEYVSSEARQRHAAQIDREITYMIDRIKDLSKDYGLHPLVEFSGGKGFHFWYILSEPTEPSLVRKVLGMIADGIRGDLAFHNVEVFPKQDRLSGKGLGNLVKLPLGIHRGTGRASYFLPKVEGDVWRQLEAISGVKPNALNWIGACAKESEPKVYLHPRHSEWLNPYPELKLLVERCPVLGRLISAIRNEKVLSVKEEKVLLWTLCFLKRGKAMLHAIFQNLPEYNSHLLDYKISTVRGHPLGCKKIHGLLDVNIDYCDFLDPRPYMHPLLHCKEYMNSNSSPPSEKVENLQDALQQLLVSIQAVLRFLPNNAHLEPLELFTNEKDSGE